MSRIRKALAAARGVNWTFAPMLDVCRDPRWGRGQETYGEDPYLSGRMAVAFVTDEAPFSVGDYEASVRVEGILDLDNSRNGQLLDLAKHGKRRPTDPFVPRELVRRLLEYEQMKLAALRVDQLPLAERDFFWVEVWVENERGVTTPVASASMRWMFETFCS